MDRFVGKEVSFTIDGKEYRLKSPPTKVLPKLFAVQGKKMESFGETEWEAIITVIRESVLKSYPEWDEQAVDDFVVQNLNTLAEKIPLLLGWATEKQLEEFKKNPPKNL